MERKEQKPSVRSTPTNLDAHLFQRIKVGEPGSALVINFFREQQKLNIGK
jgi:hypothetical protein